MFYFFNEISFYVVNIFQSKFLDYISSVIFILKIIIYLFDTILLLFKPKIFNISIDSSSLNIFIFIVKPTVNNRTN